MASVRQQHLGRAVSPQDLPPSSCTRVSSSSAVVKHPVAPLAQPARAPLDSQLLPPRLHPSQPSRDSLNLSGGRNWHGADDFSCSRAFHHHLAVGIRSGRVVSSFRVRLHRNHLSRVP